MGEITKIYLIENIEPGTNKVYIGKTKSEEAKRAISEKLKGRVSPNKKK
jgi:hypothetical protein